MRVDKICKKIAAATLAILFMALSTGSGLAKELDSETAQTETELAASTVNPAGTAEGDLSAETGSEIQKNTEAADEPENGVKLPSALNQQPEKADSEVPKSQEELQEEPQISFFDVRDHNWFYTEVTEAVRLKLVQGTGKGMFLPDNKVLRGDFAVMLSKLLRADLSLYGFSKYIDVPLDSYYSSAIAFVSAKEYINGYVDGKFRPQEKVSRAEMAVILCRALEAETVKETEIKKLYADDAAINFWARGQIYAMQQAGIMVGDSQNRFNPKQIVTRCEATAVLLRVYRYLYGPEGA